MKRLILFLLIFVAGILIGYFLLRPQVELTKSTVECEFEYSFINPQLGCGEGPLIKKHGYSDLVSRLTDYIETQKEDGVVESVSIYFRDLENGPSFGINEHERFIPASLFKLPIMSTYYLLADEEELELNQKITFNQDPEASSASQFFPPEEEVKPHTPYTLDDLIFRMIMNSDNKATAALNSELVKLSNEHRRNVLQETYTATGITYTDDVENAFITPKTYSSLFRLLYNAPFLSSARSEKALETLSKSTFNQGLVKGVPEGILVAHKFGERFDENVEEDVEQLHDCGIVYYPQNPYLLCIMTKGKYIPTLVATVASISEMVYMEVDSRKITR